jgi:hypothetical protein
MTTPADWNSNKRVFGSALAGCLMALGAVLTACGRSAGPEPTARVAIAVGALGYDAVTDADYTLEVWNGAPASGGELVIRRENLRSKRLGNGAGALSYVAPCDADTGTAHVRLFLNDLYTDDGVEIPRSTWRNPTPLLQDVVCVENADTPVTLNLTIMRDAKQGFFDVGVVFSGIFCSAKFDCLGDNGLPLKLLHRPDNDLRDTTMVLAFACTTGAGKPTWLHMSDVHVVCDDGTGPTPYWVSPLGTNGGSEGNQGGVDPVFFQTGLYRGREALPGVEKCYWNMAFGLADSAPGNCRLVVDATASTGSFAGNGGQVEAGATYPYVHFEIPFTDSEGQLACQRHAMDDGSERVRTSYTTPTSGGFAYEWACNDPEPVLGELGRVTCGGDVEGHGPTDAIFTHSPSGLSVAFGASRSPAYRMPEGVAVEGCCVSPCCTD